MTQKAIKLELRITCPGTEFSTLFLQGMVDRMSVSYLKYGAVADAYPHKVNALDSMQQRLERYLADGNTEWLMDAANFLMIEFMCPSHPDVHYEGTDSSASPGRTKTDGLVVKSMRNEAMLTPKVRDK